MVEFNTTLLILIQFLTSKPLASLTLLSLVIISLASYYAADPWKKPEAREKEQESGNVIHVTAKHAIGFGGIASLGLISMWTFPNALGKTNHYKVLYYHIIFLMNKFLFIFFISIF